MAQNKLNNIVMNTTENNKLIADFMGLNLYNFSVNPAELTETRIKIGCYYVNLNDGTLFKCTKTAFPLVIVQENENGFYCANLKNCKEVNLKNELLYNSSWDWLMSVVEKIESLDSGIYTLIFQQKSCLIWDNDNGEELEFFNGSFKAETKIEAVYSACVEFIKWYNEQQK